MRRNVSNKQRVHRRITWRNWKWEEVLLLVSMRTSKSHGSLKSIGIDIRKWVIFSLDGSLVWKEGKKDKRTVAKALIKFYKYIYIYILKWRSIWNLSIHASMYEHTCWIDLNSLFSFHGWINRFCFNQLNIS